MPMPHHPLLVLRQACEQDIERIMELEASGFAPAIRESRDVMLMRLQHFPSGFLVLENGAGKIMGYLCSEIWSTKDENKLTMNTERFALGHDIRHTHQENGDCLYISSMTIDPAYRGQGIGQRFFMQALTRLRQTHSDVSSSLLLLSAEWRNAHRIYQACGYTGIASISGFFTAIAQHDDSALVMQLSFKNPLFPSK